MIDGIEIIGGIVNVKFHLTIPYCPPVFAVKIASDIVDAVSSIEGAKYVNVEISGHYLADNLNKLLSARRFSKVPKDSIPLSASTG